MLFAAIVIFAIILAILLTRRRSSGSNVPMIVPIPDAGDPDDGRSIGVSDIAENGYGAENEPDDFTPGGGDFGGAGASGDWGGDDGGGGGGDGGDGGGD